MENEENGVNGEAAPENSPAQTTGAEDNGQQGSSTDNQEDHTTVEGKNIPYERFSEVNEKYRATQAELETNRQEIARLQSLIPPEEKPKFETAEDLLKYQDESVDKKLGAREKVLEARFEARLEATEKLNQLNQAYPEVKTDRQFAEFLTSKIRNNPNLDVLKAAEEVKQYFKQLEEKGRKSAENDFIQKGSFGGGVIGNQPLQKTDADKSYVDNIVNAGGNKSTGIF